MACNNCDDVCILISDECLCRYSHTPSIRLSQNINLVEDANEYIEQFTGDCDLCEGFGEADYQYNEIIEAKEFKRLYAAVIYAYWIRHNGAGQATKAGFSTPQADEFSKFTVNPLKQNDIREAKQWKVVNTRAEKFKNLMQTTDCIPCKEPKVINKCGCVSKCTCQQIQSYQTDSYSF